MSLSLIIAEINKRLDGSAEKAGIARKDFSSIAYQAQLLSLHFMHKPTTLPDLNVHFDEQLMQQAYVAFCGGLLFILFHELGHLVLRHGVSGNEPSTLPAPALACLEDMNFRKQQEFEADSFAFDALVPNARTMVMVNVWYVMSLYLDYESFVADQKYTHPFTINRVLNLNRLSGALDDPTVATHTSKIFDARFKLMQTRLDALHPEEHLLPAAIRAQIHREAMMKVIGTPKDSEEALDLLINAYRVLCVT